MGIEPGCFPANAIYNAPYRESTTLPLGTWNVLANGRIFRLEINSGPNNTYSIDWPGTPIRDVKWKAVAGRLTFTRVLPDDAVQHFTGYLLNRSGADPLWRIAGTFDQPNLSVTSGWYGTQPGR